MFLLGITSIVMAQDAKADRILAASKKKFMSYNGIHTDIVFTITNPNLDKPVVKKGPADFKKEKYKLDFADEGLYCNGKETYTLLKPEKECTINEYDPDESMGIEKIYSIYEQDTKSRYDGVEGGRDKISVFFQDEESDIWSAILLVNKSSKIVEKAVMKARNGSEYTYDLKNVKLNTGISDGAFTPDLNKLEDDGWYIEDMR